VLRLGVMEVLSTVWGVPFYTPPAMTDPALPQWIDSHAHLSMFEPDEVDEVLARAVAAGVVGVLVPATGAEDLDRVQSLAADRPDRVVAAVGVHPHEAASLDSELKRRVERALDADGVVAVGEVGLDYHYMNSPRDEQLRALEWHLDLAEERGLPVVLHNRESWSDLCEALERRRGRLRGVCHSFCEGAAAARTVVELGLRVGFSGMVTFRSAFEVRESVRAVESAQLLVETDSPYLAPVPHRGKRNEPAYVALVGQRVAEEQGRAPTDLARMTTETFCQLFQPGQGWPGAP
jgi:TatD DNase family protein